jgi:hypothetical protein
MQGPLTTGTYLCSFVIVICLLDSAVVQHEPRCCRATCDILPAMHLPRVLSLPCCLQVSLRVTTPRLCLARSSQR